MSGISTNLLGKKAYFTIKTREQVNGEMKWFDVTQIGEILAVDTHVMKSIRTTEVDFYFLLKLSDGRTVTKKHSDCKFVK
tara:strand:+ start:274 stop:513 length:240 start_codon:yes stop_codon:yes gene_type:complete